MVLACELPSEVTQLHAHFLHTPASVTRYASLITGIPWSCSAHARDIWTTPAWEKREKLADCLWATTCTAVNREHLAGLAPRPDHVELLYHGLDFERFSSPAKAPSARTGQVPGDAVVIVSVGRAVEKKGYDDLLDALAMLPETLHWRFVHIGGGPLSASLKQRAAKLRIAQRVSWLGSRPQEDVLRAYRGADLFVLASRIARDGDRDGLPNVLMEAQSQGLPCVSTVVSAVPELIEDGVSGILVPPRDPLAMAQALERLIREPGLRGRLGDSGRQRVRACFSQETAAQRLFHKFRASTGQCPQRSAQGIAGASPLPADACLGGDKGQ